MVTITRNECHFLFPKVQCSLGKDASQPLETSKHPPLYSACHVTMCQHVHWKRTLAKVAEGPPAVLWVTRGASVHMFAHATLSGCCDQSLPFKGPRHAVRIVTAGPNLELTWSTPLTATRTIQSLEVGQLSPNISPQAGLSESKASGSVLVTTL